MVECMLVRVHIYEDEGRSNKDRPKGLVDYLSSPPDYQNPVCRSWASAARSLGQPVPWR